MRLDLTLHSILAYLKVLTLMHEIHPYIAKANDARFESKLFSIASKSRVPNIECDIRTLTFL